MKVSVNRKVATAAAIVCAAFLTVSFVRPAISETLNLSSYLTVKHWLLSQVLTQWAKDVEEATGGEIEINILATALGKPEAHFDIARDGIADLTLAVPGYTPGRFTLTTVSSLPGVGNTAESAGGALWRMLDQFPEVKKEFEGVVPLAFISTTAFQFWTSKRRIHQFDDFTGLKMLAAGGSIIDVVRGLGAQPVALAVGEAYLSISNGVLDGVLFTTNGIDALKLSRVIKYGIRIPGGFAKAPILLAMNPDKFKSLSKKNQDILMRLSGEKLSRLAGRVWEDKDQVSLENIREAGVTVAEAAPTMRKGINGAIDSAIEKWLADVQKERNYDARPLLAAFRKETENIEADN